MRGHLNHAFRSLKIIYLGEYIFHLFIFSFGDVFEKFYLFFKVFTAFRFCSCLSVQHSFFYVHPSATAYLRRSSLFAATAQDSKLLLPRTANCDSQYPVGSDAPVTPGSFPQPLLETAVAHAFVVGACVCSCVHTCVAM